MRKGEGEKGEGEKGKRGKGKKGSAANWYGLRSFDDTYAGSDGGHASMQNANNLRLTRHARELAVATYRVTTAFPSAERFGLTAQMRRSAVSVGSNIAEGCGRFSNRELLQFLQIALGSVSELEFQALVASDLEMLSASEAEPYLKHVGRVKGMLIRLITFHRTGKAKT